MIGSKVPDFKVRAVMPDNKVSDVSLSDYAGHWIVIFSYPMDFSFVSPTEVLSFSNKLYLFEGLNCVVLGVSSDNELTHIAWKKTPRSDAGIEHTKIPLLADTDGSITRIFNWYNEEKGYPIRGTAIIDPNMVIRHNMMHCEEVGRSVDEIIRLLKATEHSSANKVLTPAEWVSGRDTIVPSWEKSRDYFIDSELPFVC